MNFDFEYHYLTLQAQHQDRIQAVKPRPNRHRKAPENLWSRLRTALARS